MKISNLVFTALAICLLSTTQFAWAQKQAGPGRQNGRADSRRGDSRRGPNSGSANQETSRQSPLLRIMDSNKDGKISATEIQAASAVLKKLDRDRDGTISADEQPSGRIGQGKEATSQNVLLRIFDTQKDGKITAAEMTAAPETLRKLDKNGDGELSKDELPTPRRTSQSNQSSGGKAGMGQGRSTGQQGRRSQGQSGNTRGRKGSKSGRGSSSTTSGRGRRGAADAQFALIVMSSDANHDGLIAKAELPWHMHAAHEKTDANKDGQLDQKEMPAFLAEFNRKKLRPAGEEPVNRPTNPGPDGR